MASTYSGRSALPAIPRFLVFLLCPGAGSTDVFVIVCPCTVLIANCIPGYGELPSMTATDFLPISCFDC